tara:strand:+ start:331 stop:594 length:264 start_codon:yes stop_codon:yes gene_type:complete
MELHKNYGITSQTTITEFVLKVNNDIYWYCRLVENDDGREDYFYHSDRKGIWSTELKKVSEDDLDKYLYHDDKTYDNFEDIYNQSKS